MSSEEASVTRRQLAPGTVMTVDGAPCIHCGLPAKEVQFYPLGNRIIHTNQLLPPCDIVNPQKGTHQ